MARVKRAVGSQEAPHKQVLERAKGYYGNKSRSFRAANEQVMRSGQYAFRDRRAKKGEFRRLWIQRINAACRLNDISYSRFIAGLQRGRHRGRPQGAGRPRRHRSGGVQRARRGRARRRSERRVLSGPLAFTNPKVQRLRRLLGRRSARTEEGAFVVEGATLIREASPPVGRSRPSTSRPALRRCRAATCSSSRPASLERVASTESPQPNIAVVRMRGTPCCARDGELRAGGRRASTTRATRHDPAVVGSRGRRRVVLTPGSVDPFNPKVVRASAGALFHVPVVIASLEEVREAGVRVIGTSSHRGDRHTDADWSGRVAIALGSEAHGLADDTRSTSGCESSIKEEPKA